MNKRNHPSITQSKEAIITSLFDLLSVKPLHTITISEISENAELDRRTFYRHFNTKEDVISYHIHEAAAIFERTADQALYHDTSLRNILLHNMNAHNFFITKIFFDLCLTIKDTLIILYKQNLMHLLLMDFNNLFHTYHQKYHKEYAPHMITPNDGYILAYHIGGFWNLLIEWLSSGCSKTPREMAMVVEEMFKTQHI